MLMMDNDTFDYCTLLKPIEGNQITTTIMAYCIIYSDAAALCLAAFVHGGVSIDFNSIADAVRELTLSFRMLFLK